MKRLYVLTLVLVLSSCNSGGSSGGNDCTTETADCKFSFETYDDFNSGDSIDETRWYIDGMDAQGSVSLGAKAVVANAIKIDSTQAKKGIWGKTKIATSAKSAFQAKMTLVDQTGDAVSGGELRFALPLKDTTNVLNTGINVYPDGRVFYFVDTYDESTDNSTAISDGLLVESSAFAGTANTVTIGLSDTDLLLCVDSIPCTSVALTTVEVDSTENWRWYSIRARVKNHSDATGEQTGQVDVIIDDVKTGSAK